jgi:hypothetical protein
MSNDPQDAIIKAVYTLIGLGVLALAVVAGLVATVVKVWWQ